MLEFLFEYDGRGKSKLFEYGRGKDASRKEFTHEVTKCILNTSTPHVKKIIHCLFITIEIVKEEVCFSFFLKEMRVDSIKK